MIEAAIYYQNSDKEYLCLKDLFHINSDQALRQMYDILKDADLITKMKFRVEVIYPAGKMNQVKDICTVGFNDTLLSFLLLVLDSNRLKEAIETVYRLCNIKENPTRYFLFLNDVVDTLCISGRPERKLIKLDYY